MLLKKNCINKSVAIARKSHQINMFRAAKVGCPLKPLLCYDKQYFKWIRNPHLTESTISVRWKCKKLTMDKRIKKVPPTPWEPEC